MSVLPENGEDDRTLYKQIVDLKGADAVASVVNSLYDKILADDEINGFFRGVDRPALERKMMVFMCSALGHGNWEGRNLKTAHEHLAIRRWHFDRVFNYLVRTLEEHDVPKPIIHQIGALLAPLKIQICIDTGRG